MNRFQLEPLTESEEQIELFRWAEMSKAAHPELSLLFHIPNGGKRNKTTAARLKREGVKPGVPDLCLPVPREDYHGLYVEMKRAHGGKTSENQEQWLAALTAQGYRTEVCAGFADAQFIIEQYIKMEGYQKRHKLVVCPYCGYVHANAFSFKSGEQYQCEQCKGLFEVTEHFEISYSTKRV